MPSTRATYDPAKVERLKNLLIDLHEKGKAKFYEIFVDKLKVVEKTNDPEEFDTYPDYMDEDTKEVKILIYNSGNSPRNDQYIFLCKAADIQAEKKQPEEMNGLDVSRQMDEKLEAAREKWEMEHFKEKYAELEKELKEAEEYIETLEKSYREEKEKKQKLGGINIGELASVAFEGIIRRNTHLIGKFPGGEALAGVIEEDNKERGLALSAPQQDTQATFKKKETGTELSEDDKQFLQVVSMMKNAFSEQQLKDVWSILKELAENSEQIPLVLELVQPQK